jgi:hypothetical protein
LKKINDRIVARVLKTPQRRLSGEQFRIEVDSRRSTGESPARGGPHSDQTLEI